ncbi:MAG: hypothetical protein G01um101413_476 [Parcubacteria group bacterium Gr01-1014_13]|nr:MAG: hypothetical protein G01um101413_476 [Parcubacteria group bacterium Gr01-1014_13]
MSSTWKIVLPVVALAIVVGAVAKFKNPTTVPAPAAETAEQNQVLGGKWYDLNSPPLTDADINAAVKIANTEPPAEAEEEKDSAMVTSDNAALNNLNNTYATDF